jgi:hypothetical protein
MTRSTPKSVRAATRGTALLLSAALVAATAPVLPRGWEAANFLASQRDETAIADSQLKSLSPDDYIAAIRDALSKGDADLADSLRALAARQAGPLPGSVTEDVDSALAEADSRMAEDAWQGFLSGHADSEPALAGALAADLTGYGDIRDLYNEADKYISGAEIDTTTVALAAVGLTLTVVTVFSLGAAAPEKAGVSVVKVVNRMGRLSRPLRRQVLTLAREAVDTDALRAFGRSLGSFDYRAIRTAAGRIVRPAPATRLKQLGADVATLGENAGYRGTLQALAKADDAAELGRMARLSKSFGRATRGALVLLGDAALTLATIAGVVFSWTVGSLFWILAAIIIATRTGVMALRLGFVALLWSIRGLRAMLFFAARRPDLVAAPGLPGAAQ